jgi:hypothetical protein
MQPMMAPVENVADTEPAISAIAHGGGLVVIGEPFTNLHRSEIFRLAAQYRQPAICPYRLYVQNGCLMSFAVMHN